MSDTSSKPVTATAHSGSVSAYQETRLKGTATLEKALRFPEVQKMMDKYEVREEEIIIMSKFALSKGVSSDFWGISVSNDLSAEKMAKGLIDEIPKYFEIRARENANKVEGMAKLKIALKDPELQNQLLQLTKQYDFKLDPNDLEFADYGAWIWSFGERFFTGGATTIDSGTIIINKDITVKALIKELKIELPKYFKFKSRK